MMFVEPRWPERAVSVIQRAVDEWATAFPEEEPLRIVWGAKDAEFEKELKERYGKDRARVDALLNWGELDCDVILLPGENPEEECDELRLRVDFGEPLLLPSKTDRLYGILRRCENYGVMPGVYPHAEKENRIAVMGIVSVIPAETVTARVIRDLLERMDSAAEEVFLWVTKREGEDLFAEEPPEA